jgi:NAD(P)-dependent dehydrogenase (short-subunit alcohol dehydrogenase family)
MTQTSMSTSLDGKVAIVTGAASGIGAATARLLLARGASVLAVDREGEALAAMVAGCQAGGRLACVCADVSMEADAQRYVSAAVQTYGSVNILVNNAGVQIGVSQLGNVSFADAERVLRVNVLGTFLGMKFAIAAMQGSGGGSIINLGSVAGMVGIPLQAMYSASKAAIINMTRAVAAEYGSQGIRANSVAPGPIQTPFFDAVLESRRRLGPPSGGGGNRLALERVGTPEEVAAVIAFLACDEASYITGAVYPIDGGFTAT